MEDVPMSPIKSGELAKQANVNSETLRYYEREGLLPEPARSESGYRQYAEEDVKRVRFIKRAQDLGFSLREIKELLALKLNASQSAREVKRLAEQKIQEIENKIHHLEAMKTILGHLVEACSGKGSVSECPIINCLDECIPQKGGEKT
jgi:Hg(II)-responsive transcriptional regulator